MKIIEEMEIDLMISNKIIIKDEILNRLIEIYNNSIENYHNECDDDDDDNNDYDYDDKNKSSMYETESDDYDEYDNKDDKIMRMKLLFKIISYIWILKDKKLLKNIKEKMNDNIPIIDNRVLEKVGIDYSLNLYEFSIVKDVYYFQEYERKISYNPENLNVILTDIKYLRNLSYLNLSSIRNIYRK